MLTEMPRAKQQSIRIPDDVREVINYVMSQSHCSFTQALTIVVMDYANKVLLPRLEASNGATNN